MRDLVSQAGSGCASNAAIPGRPTWRVVPAVRSPEHFQTATMSCRRTVTHAVIGRYLNLQPSEDPRRHPVLYPRTANYMSAVDVRVGGDIPELDRTLP